MVPELAGGAGDALVVVPELTGWADALKGGRAPDLSVLA